MKVLTAALLVVGLAACGSGESTSGVAGTGASSSAAPASLSIQNFMFSPTPLHVKAGAPIRITNKDNQPHTFTSDTPGVFDAGAIPAGGSPNMPIVVTTPGTYAFHCSFHPFMHGQLVVE